MEFVCFEPQRLVVNEPLMSAEYRFEPQRLVVKEPLMSAEQVPLDSNMVGVSMDKVPMVAYSTA